MTVTLPSAGQTDWAGPLNSAISSLDTGKANKTSINPVQDYAATGDGTTDDTAALQAALNACPAGGIVDLPRGVYRTSAPLLIPPYVTLRGTHGGGEAQSTSAPTPSCIKPLASFTGAAAITILDQQLGGYATLASEIAIRDLTVDGSAVPVGTAVDGIRATGQIQHIRLRDVQVRQMTGQGINHTFNLSAPPGPQAPFCLHYERVSILWCKSFGIALNNATDSYFSDVYVLGCTGTGWYIAGCSGSTWVGCRAEWSGGDGFQLATNNAVQTFIGCSTDRNAQNGFSIPSSGSTGTVVLSGCRMTRDGRSSTTSGYAGLNVSGTTRKVLADGIVITTGRDDDGSTGNLSPQYGVSATNSTYVVVASGDLNGVSSGWRDGGGNTVFKRGTTVTGTGFTPSSGVDWLNVLDYGAKGDGSTDDKAAIQSALSACPMGGVVYLPARQFALSSKLTIPPYVTLQGPLADRDGAGDGAACLLPKAGFTDTTVIELVDQTTGGYSTANRDVTLTNVTIDGRLLTTETVQGIRATGYVHGVQLRNVSIHKVTGHAINLVNGASGNPYSWYMQNVQISGSGSVTTWDGFHLIGTDHQIVNCRVLGVRGNGYFLSGCANTQLIGCRSEWSATNGFYITGSYGVSNGSGGLRMEGCSTDRNNNYGVLIDSTGNPPIIISGLMARRDGRNGIPGTGGGSYAALRGTGSTTPIIVTGMSCYPGVNDDGTGANSPERGVSFVSCTYVSVETSYLHADLTPFHDGGGNTSLYRGVAVATATGPTATPTRSVVGGGNLPGPITLTQGGYLAVRGSAANTMINAQVTGDTNNRYNVTVAGVTAWGDGTNPPDTNLYRASASSLKTDSFFSMGGSGQAAGQFTVFTGAAKALVAGTAGGGLAVKEGSNARLGTATLAAGTVTIANTSVTSTTRVFLQRVSGTAANFGHLTYTINPGVSVVVTSSNASDTSVFNWHLIEPA